MILEIVKYGHPALRQKGAPIAEITPEIRQLIKDMFETMYKAAGVGLAAQQVGKAVQLTVIDVREVKDRPSTLEIGGKTVALPEHMPLVLINPVIRPFGDPATGPEGCLSFPEVYADITRPEKVEVEALNAEGKKTHFVAGGLLSRAVQHETDHLNGILFIDRMSSSVKAGLKADLEEIQAKTKAALEQR
jgi:peptide deformylase